MNFIFAFGLLALTVLIHASGLGLVMRLLPLTGPLPEPRRGARTWLLIRLAACFVTLHCVEISIWAHFYWFRKCLPDYESSLYFALVTYTTLGYGDLVLAPGSRILAGVEALTGILMCGWSTGFFFAVVSRIYALQPPREA